MARRHEYQLELGEFGTPTTVGPRSAFRLRAAQSGDLEPLASLMVDAYRGTIDYEGETQAQARAEVQAYLDGRRGGPALVEASRLCLIDQQLVSACLVALGTPVDQPLIAYVMTGADWKGRQLGRTVVSATLGALQRDGYRAVHAIITAGNAPSEKLFGALGFERTAER